MQNNFTRFFLFLFSLLPLLLNTQCFSLTIVGGATEYIRNSMNLKIPIIALTADITAVSQHGNGNNTDSNVPVQVLSLSSVIVIAQALK